MVINISRHIIFKNMKSFIGVTNFFSQNCCLKNSRIRNFSIDKSKTLSASFKTVNQQFYIRNLKLCLINACNFTASANHLRKSQFFHTKKLQFFPSILSKQHEDSLLKHHLPVLQYSNRNCSNIKNNISIKGKKRVQRKKRGSNELSEMTSQGFRYVNRHNFLTFDPDFAIPEFRSKRKSGYREFEIVAYATANEYDLEALSKAFHKQGLYIEIPIVSSAGRDETEFVRAKNSTTKPEDVLYFGAAYQVTKEPREMLVFGNGAIVFWNVPLLERQNILKFIESFQSGGYDKEMIEVESETLVYTYSNSSTRIKCNQDLILLNEGDEKELEKFTFSNVMAMSVKLGIWESSLERYIESIEHVTEKLQRFGIVTLKQNQVLQKLGELFTLRHLINLSSGLLDTPDFYWDHDRLEALYNQMASHLSIRKRTSIMNTKLSDCFELLELLKGQLHDKHSSRLEWIIIILIMIEVFFEILHFI